MRNVPSRMVMLAVAIAAVGAGRVGAQAPAPEAPPPAPAPEAPDQPPAPEAPAAAAAAPLPKPDPIPEVELAPSLPTKPVRRGVALPNERLVDASVLPRDRAPQVMYVDQTANFSIGQKVTGQDSGASGTIVGDLDDGTSGTLTLSNVSGKFQEGEAIGSEPAADETGGAATILGMREGIWVLEFAFKPARLITVEIPGRGRRQILYQWYRVINRTGEPRLFVPQFSLVTDDGKRFDDQVLPHVVPVIQSREDIATTLLGAVSSTGMVPVSTKDGIDDAVFGVAVWVVNDTIARADGFQIFIRGLSDGYREIAPAEGEEPRVEYKALRLDFSRPGDERNYSEREIRLLDPPYEWVYY